MVEITQRVLFTSKQFVAWGLGLPPMLHYYILEAEIMLLCRYYTCARGKNYMVARKIPRIAYFFLTFPPLFVDIPYQMQRFHDEMIPQRQVSVTLNFIHYIRAPFGDIYFSFKTSIDNHNFLLLDIISNISCEYKCFLWTFAFFWCYSDSFTFCDFDIRIFGVLRLFMSLRNV